MSVLLLVIIFGSAGIGIFFACLVPHAWRRGHFAGGLVYLLFMLLMFMTAFAALLVQLGLKGYQAFTREEPVATVFVTPLGNQQFQVKVVRPNQRDTVLSCAGDELYMDARILKWKPFVNLLGIHTAYRLDRVAGRYLDIQDERTKVRTVYSLAGVMMPWDLFFLWKNVPFLGLVFDAHYGSAAFIPVRDSGRFRVLVTTSGLLMRPD